MKDLPGGLSALPDSPSLRASNNKSNLGQRLFFDTRLSLDRRTSCATCHDPEKAFTDGVPRSTGFQGIVLRRNAPTILNAAYNHSQFWDGRATTLDEQCKAPLLSPTEMNMIDERHLIDRLNQIPGYLRDFQSVFASGPSLDNVANAIAAFEQTLITPDAPFDRYMKGDKDALSPSEKRGLIIFFSKGACSECHKGFNFTDEQYHNLGEIPSSGAPIDLGRFEVTHQDSDMRAFKTPSLRNVARTAPYMHDGAFATLEEVIDFYDRGGDNTPNKSPLIYKLNLTAGEKAGLLAFLKSLNGTLPRIHIPTPYPDEQTHTQRTSAMNSKLIAIFILALLYSQTDALHCAAKPSPTSQSSHDKTKKEVPTIRDLMGQHIHPEFTAMSFTIWHDQPLTSAKMDRVAHSARQIIILASSLKTYSASMPEQGWSSQDAAFFDEKRLQLLRVASELERAARHRDRAGVTSFFLHLDFTCHSCHTRFRPGIS